MTELAGVARQLLLYTLWADRISLKAVEAVSVEDLERDTGTSFGSLLATLAHMLAAQRVWLARFEGKGLPDRPATGNAADWAAELGTDWGTLSAAWIETSAELGFFIASLSGDQVSADITWTSARGETHTLPLWQPVLQLVNHATYHRGQVISLLRQMGYEPPSTDLLTFLLEQPPQAPALAASSPPPATETSGV
jgi:uncharacterized damage-inducible protein DinB